MFKLRYNVPCLLFPVCVLPLHLFLSIPSSPSSPLPSLPFSPIMALPTNLTLLPVSAHTNRLLPSANPHYSSHPSFLIFPYPPTAYPASYPSPILPIIQASTSAPPTLLYLPTYLPPLHPLNMPLPYVTSA